jgi:DNA-binding response OmpR family regulator
VPAQDCLRLRYTALDYILVHLPIRYHSCHSRALPGAKACVRPPTAYAFHRQRIVVADEDSVTIAMIIATLRRAGHCVVHALDVLSAPGGVSLAQCHLLISSAQVEGMPRIDLLEELRECLPALPVLYLANVGQSTAELEAQLPRDVRVLRAPFTTGELQAAVRPLLPQLRAGTILAFPVTAPPVSTELPCYR